jgi:hypothetical protein
MYNNDNEIGAGLHDTNNFDALLGHPLEAFQEPRSNLYPVDTHSGTQFSKSDLNELKGNLINIYILAKLHPELVKSQPKDFLAGLQKLIESINSDTFDLTLAELCDSEQQNLDGYPDEDLGSFFSKVKDTVKKVAQKVGNGIQTGKNIVSSVSPLVSAIAPHINSLIPTGGLVAKLTSSPTVQLVKNIPSAQVKQIVSTLTPQQANNLAKQIQANNTPELRQSPLAQEVTTIKTIAEIQPQQAQAYVETLTPAQKEIIIKKIDDSSHSSYLKNSPLAKELKGQNSGNENHTGLVIGISAAAVAIGLGILVATQGSQNEQRTENAKLAGLDVDNPEKDQPL